MRRKPFRKCVIKKMQEGYTKKEAIEICRKKNDKRNN